MRRNGKGARKSVVCGSYNRLNSHNPTETEIRTRAASSQFKNLYVICEDSLCLTRRTYVLHYLPMDCSFRIVMAESDVGKLLTSYEGEI